MIDDEYEHGYTEGFSVYEEYAIHDYESDLSNFEIGEYDNIHELSELIERIEDLKEYELEEVMAILESEGGSLYDALSTHENGDFTFYEGIDTYAELAEMFVDEGCFGDTKAMGNLVDYIDFEALGRDLSFDGYTEVSNGIILVQ